MTATWKLSCMVMGAFWKYFLPYESEPCAAAALYAVNVEAR